jgi:beta-N-acetylhexosaminidase
MSFDVDYAPVLDVDTNPDNPVIGDRSLGRDPSVVGRLACAVIAGLREAGAGACGKHFPGHGDTDTDSHFALPRVDHDLDRLQAIEWPPFAAAVEAGLDAVMSAHVLVPVLDRERPGTLSAVVLSRLRDELGFGGVIVSDDIDMKALADRFAPADIAALGLEAGIDVFLACNRPAVAIELYRGIVHAVEQGRISHEVLLDAADRADGWYRRWWRPPSPPEALQRWVGCVAHQPPPPSGAGTSTTSERARPGTDRGSRRASARAGGGSPCACAWCPAPR